MVGIKLLACCSKQMIEDRCVNDDQAVLGMKGLEVRCYEPVGRSRESERRWQV
jgi:hypothetical protein